MRAFWNVLVAPFGNVKFKAYILAEILSDCMIPMEDLHILYIMLWLAGGICALKSLTASAMTAWTGMESDPTLP